MSWICRILRTASVLLLLAVLFLVPALVLSGGELLPEFTRLTPYARWWEVPLRTLIACALSWVWLWTEGTALQILLALLLWFCIGWALCLLLRLRKVKTSQLSGGTTPCPRPPYKPSPGS